MNDHASAFTQEQENEKLNVIEKRSSTNTHQYGYNYSHYKREINQQVKFMLDSGVKILPDLLFNLLNRGLANSNLELARLCKEAFKDNPDYYSKPGRLNAVFNAFNYGFVNQKNIQKFIEAYGKDRFFHNDYLLKSLMFSRYPDDRCAERVSMLLMAYKNYGVKVLNQNAIEPLVDYSNQFPSIKALLPDVMEDAKDRRDVDEKAVKIAKENREKDKGSSEFFIDLGEDYIAIKDTDWTAVSAEKASKTCTLVINGQVAEYSFDINIRELLIEHSIKSDVSEYLSHEVISDIKDKIRSFESSVYCPDSYSSEIMDSYFSDGVMSRSPGK